MREWGRKNGGKKEGMEEGREGEICTSGAISCMCSLITIDAAAAGPSSLISGGHSLLFGCWPGLFGVAVGNCWCCQVQCSGCSCRCAHSHSWTVVGHCGHGHS